LRSDEVVDILVVQDNDNDALLVVQVEGQSASLASVTFCPVFSLRIDLRDYPLVLH